MMCLCQLGSSGEAVASQRPHWPLATKQVVVEYWQQASCYRGKTVYTRLLQLWQGGLVPQNPELVVLYPWAQISPQQPLLQHPCHVYALQTALLHLLMSVRVTGSRRTTRHSHQELTGGYDEQRYR